MSKTQVVERMDVVPDSLYYHDHLARYRFALAHVRPGRTLDIACGSGYGTAMLGRQPGTARAYGVDIDRETLIHARRRYEDAALTFIEANGTMLPFCDASFDTIVSLETLEHIQDDRAFLRELVRVLRPDGVCILSTPNRHHSERHHRSNPFHVREYSESELLSLLHDYFSSTELAYQGYSGDYYNRVRSYADAIQAKKKHLNPFMRFGIDRIYRPLKRFIPADTTNLMVRRLLGLAYPRTEPVDIAVSREPLEDTNVFIAILKQPRGADQTAV